MKVIVYSIGEKSAKPDNDDDIVIEFNKQVDYVWNPKAQAWVAWLPGMSIKEARGG